MEMRETGGLSAADAFVQRAHRAADYVLAINHCRECQDSRTCLYRGCSGARRVLRHSDVCLDAHCRYPGCDSTKQLLLHISECRIYRNGMANIDISRSPTFCLMCSLIVRKHREQGPLTTTVNHRPFARSSSEVPFKKQRAWSESHVSRGQSSWTDETIISSSEHPVGSGVGSLETVSEHPEDEEPNDKSSTEDPLEASDGKEEVIPSTPPAESRFEVPPLPKRYRSQTID